MKVGKLFRVGVKVRDLDKAAKLFSELFGIEFVRVNLGKVGEGGAFRKFIETPDAIPMPAGTELKMALDPKGLLQLLEANPPWEQEGLFSIHFQVPDLEVAKAEMERKGIRLMQEVHVGDVKEATYHPGDAHGIQVNLVEFLERSTVDRVPPG